MKYIYQYLITFKYKTDNIYKAQQSELGKCVIPVRHDQQNLGRFC
jgi:hypothetical protein